MSNSQTGVVPPQNIQGEVSVLGAILLEKDAIHEVAGILTPNDFYKDSHKKIYKACVDLYTESEPIDLTTVVAKARNNKLNVSALEVAELTTTINSSANIETHARIIVEMSMRRQLIQRMSNVSSKAYDESSDIFDVISECDVEVAKISSERVRGDFKPISDTITDTIIQMYENKDEEITGVLSGFPSLDKITGGFQPDNLIIIAARPGMGKTAFVVSVALEVAKSGKPCGLFSLEMSTEQINKRVISSESEINLNKVIKPKLMTDYDWDQVHFTNEKVKEYPIYIDDTASLSIIELKTKAKKMKRDHGIEMLIVDYLQLMKGDSNGNREQEIGSISRALKGISKELGIPVIALSQLSRAVETRGGDKRPMLSDLRESGSIEQDADMVMFLYRPEYYGIEHTEDGESLLGKGVVIVAKNRHGSLDDVYLNFTGRFTKWHE